MAIFEKQQPVELSRVIRSTETRLRDGHLWPSLFVDFTDVGFFVVLIVVVDFVVAGTST